MSSVACLLLGTVLAAAAPPPACAARDDAFLRRLVGDWDVETEFRSGSSPAFERAAGRAVVSPDLSGCVLTQRFTGTRSGEPWSFLVVLGANGGGGGPAIQELFVHSQHGILSLSSGEVAGGELVLEDAVRVDGKTVLIRHVYSEAGPSGFRYESRRSTDGGASWTTTWRAKYRRTAPAAPPGPS